MRYPVLAVIARRVVIVLLLLAGFLFVTREWRPEGLPSDNDAALEDPGASWSGPSAAGASGRPGNPAAHDKINKMAHAIVARFKAVPLHQARQIARAALRESAQQGVSTTLILAVCAVESSFNPLAINGHDHGLMQVNVNWQKDVTAEVGGPKGLLVLDKGVHAGTKVLKTNLQRSRGNTRLALRMYNGLGKNNEYPTLVLNQKAYFDSALWG